MYFCADFSKLEVGREISVRLTAVLMRYFKTLTFHIFKRQVQAVMMTCYKMMCSELFIWLWPDS